METEIQNINEKLMIIVEDVELIKNILLSEGELTPWAKKELAEARKIPRKHCISHEEVKKRILKK